MVRASAITALVGLREAAREVGQSTVIHNLISARAVPELLGEAGITAVRSRVGHSFIKAQMAEHDAIFGGEHSAHFYFRDFFYADSGMLAALHVMAALGQQDGPLSAMLEAYDPYAASGEINSTVTSVPEALARIRDAFGTRDGVVLDEFDGLTVTHWDDEPRWWFNVRPSGTEPLLRLNVEAATVADMEAVRDEALRVIREG